MSSRASSAELLQKIKNSVNMIDVIGEHVVLKKSGSNFTGLCPFHSERTPSFSVSETKQLYHCHGCKRGGDLLTFVMEMGGVSFRQAVEELSDRARIPLPQDWKGKEDPHEDEKRKKQRLKENLAFKLNRFTAAFYNHQLPLDARAVEYYRTRGIHQELMKSFYLGSATPAWDALANHLVAKQAPLDLALELGLVRPSPRKTQGYFDFFRERVIFPILNQRGKVVGFGGRTLSGETPKYLNSGESFIFQKSKVTFGLFQAQKHIREKDEVILVEGYFDVLAMVAAGFQNVVATCGTALTADHLNSFKKLASKVTVLFDGDKAGVAATERAMEIGLENGWVIYGAQMPEGLDPDEVLLDSSESGRVSLSGKEKMTAIIKGATALLDSRIQESFRAAQRSPEDRTQALKKIARWLNAYSDPVGREVRIPSILKHLGISRNLLQEAMGKKPPGKGEGVQRESIQVRRVKAPQMGAIDRTLLLGVVRGGDYLKDLLETGARLPPQKTLADLIEYPAGREFLDFLLSLPELPDRLRNAPDTLLVELRDEQVRSVLTEGVVSQNPLVSLEDFRGAILKSLAKIWARFSQQIKAAMTGAELNQDIHLQAQLMKEYLDVQRKMKEFINFYDEA